jgi:hypothetical protein
LAGAGLVDQGGDVAAASRRQHLEGIGRRGPDHVGPLAGGQFAHVGDALHGVLVEDLDLDAGLAFSNAFL